MKLLAPVCLLALVTAARAADAPTGRLLDATVQSRVGFDSNPTGVSGTSASVLGDEGTMTYSGGAGVSLASGGATPKDPFVKISYAGESVRFDRTPDENFSTHRLGFGGKYFAGGWVFSGEGSSLYVAGHRETLTAVPTVNANGTALWRERRRQWQHRGRFQVETTRGDLVVRAGARWLAYDYRTAITPGKVTFADRSDTQVSTDLGWKQNAHSLWLAGVRVGRQRQEVVKTGDKEYSNDYLRLGLGWEGKLFDATTVTIMGGPDFRDYTGDVATGFDRRRASFWVEGGAVTKLGDTLTISAKLARMAWLSSTGKTAYMDTCAEITLAKTLTPAWTVQLTAKVHQCDYYPTVRDDWESIAGASLAWKVSKRITLSTEVLSHRAWNEIDTAPERDFDRVVVNVGACVKF